MRSFLDPALFSSSCKPSGQEAIHFPLANTHLHLEPSHAHLDRELGAGPGPVLTSSSWHSRGDFQHPRAVGGGHWPQQSSEDGTQNWGAGWHLLDTSLNVPVASTTSSARGAGWLWGALMGCKNLVLLRLVGSSPFWSRAEPRCRAQAGMEAVGRRRG